MKLHLKTSDLKYGVTTLLLIALVCISVAFNRPNSSYKTVAKDIDGETLFTGIFFGNKTLGSIIPELNLPDSLIQNPARKSLVTQAIKNARLNNAMFFKEFKEGLESGDPGEVDASINMASLIINQTIDKLKDKKESQSKFDLAGAVVDVHVVLPSGIVVYPGPQTGTDVIYGPASFAYLIRDSGANNFSSDGINREKYISFLTNTFNMN